MAYPQFSLNRLLCAMGLFAIGLALTCSFFRTFEESTIFTFVGAFAMFGGSIGTIFGRPFLLMLLGGVVGYVAWFAMLFSMMP